MCLRPSSHQSRVEHPEIVFVEISRSRSTMQGSPTTRRGRNAVAVVAARPHQTHVHIRSNPLLIVRSHPHTPSPVTTTHPRPFNRRLYHLRTFFKVYIGFPRCVTYHDDGTHHPRVQVHLTEILPCIAVLVFFFTTGSFSLFFSLSLSLCLFLSLYLFLSISSRHIRQSSRDDERSLDAWWRVWPLRSVAILGWDKSNRPDCLPLSAVCTYVYINICFIWSDDVAMESYRCVASSQHSRNILSVCSAVVKKYVPLCVRAREYIRMPSGIKRKLRM